MNENTSNLPDDSSQVSVASPPDNVTISPTSENENLPVSVQQLQHHALGQVIGRQIIEIQTAGSPSDSTVSTNADNPEVIDKHKKFIVPHIVMGFAILLLILGYSVVFIGFKTKSPSSGTVSAGTSGDDFYKLDETEPDKKTFSQYHVSTLHARFLKIPQLGILARIIRMGITSKNQIQSPLNLFDVGWYENSALPGEPGVTVLDGHVRGPTKDGIFANLKDLKAGDDIQIELGNGKTVNYKVVKLKYYDFEHVDMAEVLVPVQAGKSGLNLITCAGKFVKSRDSYDQRLVVFAVVQ